MFLINIVFDPDVLLRWKYLFLMFSFVSQSDTKLLETEMTSSGKESKAIKDMFTFVIVCLKTILTCSYEH